MGVRGRKADVVVALRAVSAAFGLATVLAFPSGARFMRWWPAPGGSNQLRLDPDKKGGEDVWIGEVTAGVWSVRVY